MSLTPLLLILHDDHGRWHCACQRPTRMHEQVRPKTVLFQEATGRWSRCYDLFWLDGEAKSVELAGELCRRTLCLVRAESHWNPGRSQPVVEKGKML